jgi:uncharacterized protein (DUF2235 family)
MGNLVVCCDGTWNTAEQKDGGVPVPTNVTRLFNTVADRHPDGTEQLKYYHPGVGTEGGLWSKLTGAGVGAGLGKNIQSGYRWLCGQYRPGDRIFLFGFSRGAYTVRSLAGMIGRCGLLDLTKLEEPVVWKRVEKAYSEGYRDRKELAEWAAGWDFHPAPAGRPFLPIHFLGVWDTVGALGVPDDLEIANLLDDVSRYSFHDTDLSDRVLHGRHAVSLDEDRASYTPTLWKAAGKHPDVKEVWFPGVHSDVGGGYKETGLSDGALAWMIGEAEAKECGLAFEVGMKAQIKPDCRDVLHDSHGGIGKLLRTQPRSIPLIAEGNAAVLHASTLGRHQTPPITQAPYRKSVVLKKGQTETRPIFAVQPWNDTWIYLEAGATYELKATGQWLDRSIKSGPGGASDKKFQAGEVVHAAGALFGKVEGLFQKVSGNEKADFLGTRREEKMPWFALVGAIANGGNPREDGTPEPHETFKIGDGCTYTPKRSGYLHCFANDAWHFYDNNRGSVTLSVTRKK